MKKLHITVPGLIATVIFSCNAFAEGSVQHFKQSATQVGQSASYLGQSAAHSAKATGNALVGSAQVVAGVAAIPFKAGGVVGDASKAAGNLLWNVATGTQSQPLDVSEETVTAGPAPTLAINNQ